MPISQDRMIALIRATQDYSNAVNFLISIIQSNTQRAASGEITAEKALFENINMHTRVELLLHEPIQSSSTLTREAHHFKLTAKRNIRMAARARRKREELGTLPRYPQPQSLSRLEPSIKIDSKTNAELDQLVALSTQKRWDREHPQHPAPTSPTVDLAHDPDDPENFMSGGLGISPSSDDPDTK